MKLRGEDIIFIIGSPRSGTTWLQKLLASHDAIVTGQESEFFITVAEPILTNYFKLINNPSGRGGTGLPCYLTTNELLSLLKEIFYEIVSKVRSDKVPTIHFYAFLA